MSHPPIPYLTKLTVDAMCQSMLGMKQELLQLPTFDSNGVRGRWSYSLGEYNTCPSRKDTPRPLSSIMEIDIEFFFSPGTNNTSLKVMGLMDSLWNIMVSHPTTLTTVSSPYTTSTSIPACESSENISRAPIMWLEAPLSIYQVLVVDAPKEWQVNK